MLVRAGVVLCFFKIQYFIVNGLGFDINKKTDELADLIQNAGYSVDIHNIWTEDGYRVRLHRILPYKSHDMPTYFMDFLNQLSSNIFLKHFLKPRNSHIKKSDSNKKRMKKKPLLLVHGLLCSGSMWITNSSNSLAYSLTDAGYDVWLFSARGSSPSMQHKRWTTKNPKFWDFSWHEIGFYDITRSIDYILEKTGFKNVAYVGHSQGSTAFIVAMTTRPEYNKKISLAVLIAPAVYLKHVQGFVGFLINTKLDEDLLKFFNQTNMHHWELRQKILIEPILAFCQDPFINAICAQGINTITGPGSETGVNVYGMVVDLIKYVADNASVKQLIHFLQIIHSGKFQQFDYGTDQNKIYYNNEIPSEYNLTAMDVPTIYVSLTKDALITPKDAKRLYLQIRKSILSHVIIPGNHVDFLFDPKAIHRIKDEILSTLKR